MGNRARRIRCESAPEPRRAVPDYMFCRPTGAKAPASAYAIVNDGVGK